MELYAKFVFMNEELIKQLAAQLRQPNGEMGVEVSNRMNQGNAFMNGFAIDQLKLAGNETLLEIGPGNCLFAKELLSKYANLLYRGVDYSDLMILEAKKMVREFIQQGRASIHHTSIADLPFPDETCDKILGVNVIYFWDTPEVELKELGRVLRPNGTIVLGMRAKETMEQLPVTKYNFNLYSKEDISGFVNKAGLKLVEIASTPEDLTNMNGEKIVTESWAVVIGK